MSKKIVINLDEGRGLLKEGVLNESWMAQFGAGVKLLLGRMFGMNNYDFEIKGNKQDVNAFVDVVSKEKNYIKSMHKHGLDEPQVLQAKGKLRSAVEAFEKETGLKYPFKV